MSSGLLGGVAIPGRTSSDPDLMVGLRAAVLLQLAAVGAFSLRPPRFRPTTVLTVRMHTPSEQPGGDAATAHAPARAHLESHLEPAPFSPLAAVRAGFSSSSFGEFMAHLRSEQGDAVFLDLWPFAPKTYLLMGKEANRDVLSSLDPGLEQILQELINVLPISAKVPSEVDVELQRKVASLFQSERVVNERLPSFGASAREMQQQWEARPPGAELNVFCELSEYVLLADLEVICAPPPRFDPSCTHLTCPFLLSPSAVRCRGHRRPCLSREARRVHLRRVCAVGG